MKTKPLHINRADGAAINADAYSFNTLWQEITNGISSMGNTIVNGLATTEKTKQLRDYEDIQGRLNWSESVLNGNKQSNTGFYFVAIILVLALVALLGFVIYKKNK